MKPNSAADDVQLRSLDIETWHKLGLEGNILPVTICLEGDSMRPLIRRGRDRVTILPVVRQLEKGDIVLFKGGPGRYVVHRIYRMHGDFVQTFGDNCYKPDPWIPIENVWGLVMKMERNGRTYGFDSSASRAFGRFWMFTHPVRVFCRRCRNLAVRCIKKILRMVKA